MKKETEIQEIIEAGFPVFDKKELYRKLSKIKEIRGYMSIEWNALIDKLSKNGFLNSFIMTDISGYNYLYYYYPKKSIDIYDIAIARSNVSYFSFYSALFINGLTLQIPKQIYMTCERTKLDSMFNNKLEQKTIDSSFMKVPRITQNKRVTNGYTINLINGQFQNRIGVIPFRDYYYVTDIERTLIDIVIRPFYAGGVTQVLDAFINAKDTVDISKLSDYYKSMNLFYPYHQAIGFYLERAKYPESALALFEKIEKTFKFYLTYNMSNMLFSERWNLYYPKGL